MNETDVLKMIIEMHSDLKVLRENAESEKKIREQLCEDIQDLKSFKNKIGLVDRQ